MKGRRTKHIVERTHVKQPGPGPKVPKAMEFGPFATQEEADAATAIAMAEAKKMGLKATVTTIRVHK